MSAYFKAFGRELDAGFDGLRVNCFDGMLHEFSYKGKKYITTYKDMREMLLNEKWTKDFNRVLHVGSKSELDKAYKRYADLERARISGKLVIDLPDDEDEED